MSAKFVCTFCARSGHGCLDLRLASGSQCSLEVALKVLGELVRPTFSFCVHLQSVEETQDCRLLFSEFTCISAPSLAAAVLNSDLSVKTFRLGAGFAFSTWVRSAKVALRVLGEREEPAILLQCSCFSR